VGIKQNDPLQSDGNLLCETSALNFAIQKKKSAGERFWQRFRTSVNGTVSLERFDCVYKREQTIALPNAVIDYHRRITGINTVTESVVLSPLIGKGRYAPP
jgi:hypothetical protein